MRAMLLIAGRDLRSRLRDRSGLVAGILAPAALAVIISLAFGGAGTDPVRLALADADGSALSADIAAELREAMDDVDEVILVDVASRAEASALVDEAEVGAAVILPAGLQEALEEATGEPEEVAVGVIGGAGAPLSTAIAEGLAGAVAAQVEQTATAVAATVATGVQQAVAEGAFAAPDDADDADVALDDDLTALLLPPGVEGFEELGEEAAQAEAALALEEAGGAEDRLDAASYFGPSMAVLSALLVVTTAPRALIRERRTGTLQRLRAAPIPAWAPAAGLGVSVAVVGLVAMLVIQGIVAVALGASLGDPLGLLALSLAVVAFAGALSALIASLVRTESQADGLATAVTFSLALVGGHFIELHALPEGLQTLALATPNGWALRGYTALAADGASVTEILAPIGVVLGFAVVLVLLALPGLRRQGA